MPIRILVAALLCGLFSGCLGDGVARMRIDGGDEVIFVFSGGGWLTRFTVQNIGVNRKPKNEDNIMWEIAPEVGSERGRHVLDIEKIKYGVVPDGYRQVKPAGGTSAKLTDGTYMGMPAVVSAPYRPIFFTIKDAKVLPAESQKN